MATFLQNKVVVRLRRVFHWLRVAVLFVLFLVVFIFVYLHQIGLPGFARQSVVQKLHQAGWDVQFTTARLIWGHELVLENAAGKRAGQPLAPGFSAGRLELDASLPDLLRSQIKYLRIFDGQIRFPLSETNREAISLDQLQFQLTFLTNDMARLDQTHATLRGIQIDLGGMVSHVSALRGWKFPRTTHTNANFPVKLREFSEVFSRLELSPPPKLEINFTGDGRDTNSLEAELKLTAPSARTPWGSLKQLNFTAVCTNILHPIFGIRITAKEVATQWGLGNGISLTANLSRNAVSNFEGNIILSTETADVRWNSRAESNRVHASALRWNGAVTLAATNFFPLAVNGVLESGPADSGWGSAVHARLAVQASTRADKPAAPAEWAVWAKLAPYAIEWQAEITKVTSPKLELETATLSGVWQAPNLVVTNVAAKLYRGTLMASANLNIASRECRVKSVSDFDPLGVTQLMTPMAQHFFSQFEWQKPPKINGDLSVILPAWTNRQPDWRGEVAPTVKIAGKFSVGESSFRKIPATFAESQFGYTNRTWNLPRLHAAGPSGEVYLDYRGSEITHEYYFLVDSEVDPQAARPLFEPQQQHFFDEASFSEKPKIHGEIWGQWRERERLGFKVNLAVTNFTVRSETVKGLTAALEFTNQVLQVRDIHVFQPGGQATTPLAVADFGTKKVLLTNVLSTIDPHPAIRAIGPRGPKYLLALEFMPPPTIRINGSFAMTNPLATDVHFDIVGDHFRWTNLVADHVSGRVDWVGRTAVLTNVQASLYGGGRLDGTAFFKYEPKQGTDFRFQFTVTNVSLTLLAQSLKGGKTNRLEGLLDGHVVIDAGHTHEMKSWNGHGYGNVTDGVLWDIPMFGIFSPILNEIKDGAGNSRAREASADFVITNGMVFSQDLEIHSSAVRLLYKGSVSFDKKLDATVEAELLRDTPLIGRLVSIAFMPITKLFKFKITGTTDKPVSEPLYMPPFLMHILRPFNTLKHLFPSNQDPNSTEPLTAPKQGK